MPCEVKLGTQSLHCAVKGVFCLGYIGFRDCLDSQPGAQLWAGVPRVSVDLMVAVPGETAEGIARGVEAVVARGVTHVSAYSLQVEEATLYAAKVARGALSPPGDDAAADRYALVDSPLLPRGFRHYEVSNYAIPGAESRHNEGYWSRRPYLGLGPGAHSFDGARRWANEHDTARYLERVERDRAGIEDERNRWQRIAARPDAEDLTVPTWGMLLRKGLLRASTRQGSFRRKEVWIVDSTLCPAVSIARARSGGTAG